MEFKFDRAAVPKTFGAGLQRIARDLKAAATQLVVVEGHTDSLGSHVYNDRLSGQRAASVKRYLVALGVDPARIETVGYGERRPIADNATAQGRQKNRRGMIIFLPTDE